MGLQPLADLCSPPLRFSPDSLSFFLLALSSFSISLVVPTNFNQRQTCLRGKVTLLSPQDKHPHSFFIFLLGTCAHFVASAQVLNHARGFFFLLYSTHSLQQ